jgi:hypothetical protein
VNRHIVLPFEVAEQLQVSMQTVRRGFSRKTCLYVGITARCIRSDQNTLGTGRNNFWRRNSGRDMCGYPGIYSDRRDIPENRSIMKRGYVKPVEAPQLRLGNLGSFGD